MSLPKPYFQDDAVTIYHGDARELLPLIPKADLVLTDPPYGIRVADHGHGKANGRHVVRNRVTGDSSSMVGQAIVDEAAALELPLIVFASPMKPWAGQWRQFLVWDKGEAVGGGGDTGTCFKQTWELIQIARTGKLCGPRSGAVLRFPVTRNQFNLHPAQKPLSLLKFLIGKVGAAAVLDPFMGSGSTLVAAKTLGRRAIGIEIEERYCAIAAKRMSQAVLL